MSEPKRTYIIRMETTDQSIYEYLKWLQAEWDYVIKKFGSEHTAMWNNGTEDAYLDEWERQITQYFGRARAHGVNSFKGRQAIAKMATTAVAMAGSVHNHYGELPDGGHTSGETYLRGEPVQ